MAVLAGFDVIQLAGQVQGLRHERDAATVDEGVQQLAAHPALAELRAIGQHALQYGQIVFLPQGVLELVECVLQRPDRRLVPCRQHLQLDVPFLVDTIADTVGAMYSGMPNRLYLIDTDGRVAFKSGRGPFGFKPSELEQALIWYLAERQPAAPTAHEEPR